MNDTVISKHERKKRLNMKKIVIILASIMTVMSCGTQGTFTVSSTQTKEREIVDFGINLAQWEDVGVLIVPDGVPEQLRYKGNSKLIGRYTIRIYPAKTTTVDTLKAKKGYVTYTAGSYAYRISADSPLAEGRNSNIEDYIIKINNKSEDVEFIEVDEMISIAVSKAKEIGADAILYMSIGMSVDGEYYGLLNGGLYSPELHALGSLPEINADYFQVDGYYVKRI